MDRTIFFFNIKYNTFKQIHTFSKESHNKVSIFNLFVNRLYQNRVSFISFFFRHSRFSKKKKNSPKDWTNKRSKETTRSNQSSKRSNQTSHAYVYIQSHSPTGLISLPLIQFLLTPIINSGAERFSPYLETKRIESNPYERCLSNGGR